MKRKLSFSQFNFEYFSLSVILLNLHSLLIKFSDFGSANRSILRLAKPNGTNSSYKSKLGQNTQSATLIRLGESGHSVRESAGEMFDRCSIARKYSGNVDVSR